MNVNIETIQNINNSTYYKKIMSQFIYEKLEYKSICILIYAMFTIYFITVCLRFVYFVHKFQSDKFFFFYNSKS